MKASEAKPFIGKMVRYYKKGWEHSPRYGVVQSTVGRNIILDCDALWAPDIVRMEIVEEPPARSAP